MTFSHLISTSFYGDSSAIKFNVKGDRTAVAYQILNNIQEGSGNARVVGIMVGFWKMRIVFKSNN